VLMGLGFMGFAFVQEELQYKTVVQALLFMCLGAGGLIVTMRSGAAQNAAEHPQIR